MTQPATILYIEDDDAGRLMIQRALTYAGYRVVAASQSMHGLELARTHRPDLVLIDIDLPDMSEAELMMRLRAEPGMAAVPVVALIAADRASEHDRAARAGMTGTIDKPVDVATLTKKLEDYLTGHHEPPDPSALAPVRAAVNREIVQQLESNVRELEAINRDLLRLDQIKDDFIQLTAHELRTPLTTVYGYNRLVQTSPAIQEMMARSPEVQAVLSGLSESIERLNGVISEIITISRIASGRVELKMGPTNLHEVLKRVIDGYAQVIEQRSLTLYYDLDEWPSQFFADSSLLELAYSNLLSNAIKYTPDGGAITLQATVSDGWVVTRIMDTGIGIDPDQQQLIFDHFYTAGDTQLHSTSKTAFRGGGLGLGLAISRGVVEAHGGRIWVESEGCDEERLPGSTFTIEIPLKTQIPNIHMRRSHGASQRPGSR
ncbi:MAG TPA: hybrid sensor histidine kinase/response regulator [Aggregatilinea sp.]|jgi:signal transduction histidine kinase|uniref:ATP-binding response regulator n=1 Tax=Aggregatilinea sp. TaxID=2806333 RepID=UPI002CBC48D9|nr:hybrid sensor histidine kinase/response regulator [Aggregatilinea sp.]HML23969.1 hybrid sensor histidine kinase/response regulator [Aggregatilinea sp.]